MGGKSRYQRLRIKERRERLIGVAKVFRRSVVKLEYCKEWMFRSDARNSMGGFASRRNPKLRSNVRAPSAMGRDRHRK